MCFWMIVGSLRCSKMAPMIRRYVTLLIPTHQVSASSVDRIELIFDLNVLYFFVTDSVVKHY